jgi:arylformamidase
MKRPIDISLSIDPAMLVWPGDPPVEVTPLQQMAKGDAANVSEVRMGTHTGTHVDPPLHFVPGGGGIDTVPLDVLVGEAVVVDARHLDRPMGASDLEKLSIPEGTERVLVRTANSDLWRRERVKFPPVYACLTTDSARWVVDRGIRLIGVDFLSVEAKGADGHPVHHTLLENGVVIVEGLDLGEVEPGRYTLVCMPLRISGGDGGPARAILFPN